MATFEYPEAVNTSELQVWNNAAFDNEESESSATESIKVSWSDIQRACVNQRSETMKSDCSKENFSPQIVKSPVYVKSAVNVKPLQSNCVAGNSQVKQLKFPQKPVPTETFSRASMEKFDEDDQKEKEKACDERNIDLEIEELEKEINRLSTRLKSLRLEKADQNTRTMEKRGRMIPAKFMESKQTAKNLDGDEKVEESSRSISRMKLNRRGLSLGPSEIFSGTRRTGVSLGPSEIMRGIGPRRPAKLEITPVQPIQSRRKSCFWKLQEIDEIKTTRGKGNSLSVSPRSRKTGPHLQVAVKPGAATTVGCKRPIKKEDVVIGSIQPKRLFKDGEKSVPASSKKPLKPGRVVASRYNQISNGNSGAGDARKRSLPENIKEESRCEKKLASSVGKPAWSIAEMEMLPRIRIMRSAMESPRDSGPAKRVAELIGKKSYFWQDEEVEPPVCQELSFAEEDEGVISE